VTHTQIEIPTDDGVCPAHAYTPRTPGPWPAVLVFMDGVGIRPTLVEHCERLAEAGYFTLLPDLFYRSGPYEPQDPAKLFADPAVRGAWFARHRATTTSAAVMRDTRVFLEHIAVEPGVRPGPVGAVGYCMGGRMAVTAAGHYPDRFAAVAAYHPGNLADAEPDSPHLLAAKITAEVYVAAASDDPTLPEEQKQRLIAAFDAAGVKYTLETYPARHGWVFPDIPVYDAAGNARHWATLLELFARTLAR
jgi:carboxymethylenebutenolidase